MTVKKVIVVGLIVLLLESIGGYIYLTYRKDEVSFTSQERTFLSASIKPMESNPSKKAILTLEASPSAIRKGESFKVNAFLEAISGNVSAVDLTLKYDPSYVTVVATDSAHPFASSSIFPKIVFNSFDDKHGIATMSGVIEEGPAFEGNGLLTSLLLKTKKAGSSEISIVFTPSETRDTNVVSETKDILESVQNLKLTILP